MSAEMYAEYLPGGTESASGLVLPEFCFTPDIATQFTERERIMLAYMIEHGGEELAPNVIGNQVTGAKRTDNLVSICLAKAMAIPALGGMIERGRYTNRRYCKWKGEPAKVMWSPDFPPRRAGIPKEYHGSHPANRAAPRRRRSASLPKRGSVHTAHVSLKSVPGPTLVPTRTNEAKCLDRDEERGRHIFADWQLSVQEQNGELGLAFRDERIPDINMYGVEIVEMAAQIDNSLSIGEVRQLLSEYAGEPVGFKSIIDQLDAIQAAFCARGIAGWNDSASERRHGQNLRMINFSPRLPE